MTQSLSQLTNAERLALLTQVGPGTDMGRLLRRFWHPVAVAAKTAPGKARAIKVLGEELTLYRGESSAFHLVDGRCPHRRTLLHTGWVQGEEVRCIYHGWKFSGAGQCTEAPAEGAETAAKIRIKAYPVREYWVSFLPTLARARRRSSTCRASLTSKSPASSSSRASRYGRRTFSR